MAEPSLKPARVRLLLAVVLFVAWIGWLGYLAATVTNPVVLSRPQFLMADLDVIAEIPAADEHAEPRVRVVEVLWARHRADRKRTTLTIANLADVTPEQGWHGAGQYLLPLRKTFRPGGKVEYQVPSIPRSPGYHPARGSPTLIYPATSETRRQEERMRSGEWDQ